MTAAEDTKRLPGESEEDYDARVYHMYSLDQLQAQAEEIENQKYIVQQLIPTQGVVGLFGDSGLGKTPFIYQMLLCVASGQPFLGLDIEQGPVLYLGYEDSTTQTNNVIKQQMLHLRMEERPKNFHVWSVNDASSDYGHRHKFTDLVKRKKPKLVVLDPIASFFPGVEDSATNATNAINELRLLGKDVGCTTLFLHHLKKAKEDGEGSLIPWEDVELSVLLQRARGSNAIVSAIDTRILFGRVMTKGVDILGVRGRDRGQSEFPMMLLSRDYDDDGEVLGYNRMVGKDLMTNLDYKGIFERLPKIFRFTDAVVMTGKSKPTISLCLKDCVSKGILRKEPGKNGRYVKVEDGEYNRNMIVVATPREREIVLGTNGHNTSRFSIPSGTSDWARWVADWDHTQLNEVPQ